MRIQPIVLFLFSLFLVIVPNEIVWGQTSTKKCNKQLSPLKKTKNAVIDKGGMWGLFERHKELREKSNRAIQLDSKIQQLIWLLDYLCSTSEGVPLNELATYLIENLKTKSKPEFKKELIVLGKSESEIDLWFIFSDIAKKNKSRKLKMKSISNSIDSAYPLLQKYKVLAEKINSSPDKQDIANVDALFLEIEELESSDPYLSLALLETSQVPHWDIDESTGGS